MTFDGLLELEEAGEEMLMEGLDLICQSDPQDHLPIRLLFGQDVFNVDVVAESVEQIH